MRGKLFGSQHIGFWSLGMVLFALQEIPYLVMPLFHLENNPIMRMQETSAFLDICEKVLGVSCIALLVFVVQEHASVFSVGSGIHKAGFVVAAAALLLNYVGWSLYFAGYQSFAIMMGFLVALPPLYYASIGLWRGNWPLFITGLVFEVIHFVHVYGNLRGW